MLAAVAPTTAAATAAAAAAAAAFAAAHFIVVARATFEIRAVPADASSFFRADSTHGLCSSARPAASLVATTSNYSTTSTASAALTDAGAVAQCPSTLHEPLPERPAVRRLL